MKVTFNAPYLPDSVRDQLSSDAERRLLDIFGTKGAAKLAFDAHRRMPEPRDSAEQALSIVLEEAGKNVTRDFGPTAAQKLRALVTFNDDAPTP